MHLPDCSLGSGFAQFEGSREVPALVGACHGTVLELGCAIGNQLQYFDKEKITHVYGIEPNALFEDSIAAKIKETGFQDRYTAITCGIEDGEILGAHGIVPGSLDCVLSIQVLCSVQDLKLSTKLIYDLLKDGGEVIFWEHGQSHDFVSRCVQRKFRTPPVTVAKEELGAFWARSLISSSVLGICDLVWPLGIGGCHLNRPIKDTLLQAGNWEVVEMATDEVPWDVFPRTWGKFRKIGDGAA
jgi:SAM-dependent methyltransferase